MCAQRCSENTCRLLPWIGEQCVLRDEYIKSQAHTPDFLYICTANVILHALPCISLIKIFDKLG